VASRVLIVLHGAIHMIGFRKLASNEYSRDPLTAHGVPPVMLLYVFSHFQQEAVGDPAPPPFLDYFNRRVHKNQCDDEVPHDQTLVG
jgi:hypothetical protein